MFLIKLCRTLVIKEIHMNIDHSNSAKMMSFQNNLIHNHKIRNQEQSEIFKILDRAGKRLQLIRETI